ncbi:hypothetical protein P171DRAFT_160675 [Karstenula rhodostoma CBS 690.94]|uniref:Uncharacterized protein n=1 Tax=Karstenula rhodostoma CBS 690.94 TaxID=1392251 RepID=A0A9P4P4W8_9PLEO|nr:hypothetical protein P171DRAFT_160675 [Karstenula rhodostoma CBS 690.94]
MSQQFLGSVAHPSLRHNEALTETPNRHGGASEEELSCRMPHERVPVPQPSEGSSVGVRLLCKNLFLAP